MSVFEIGATLRETRMRARIDISEVEEKTKIRAKYLRALENEEWGLLPGPTYVKSFLKTYADYLGLDATQLVDEYRLRYEKVEETDRKPVGGSLGKGREQARRPIHVPRGLVIALICIALVVVLFVLGSISENKDSSPVVASTSSSAESDRQSSSDRTHESSSTNRSRPKRVSLRVIPTGPVWVCLENAKGKRLIPGEAISPTTKLHTYKSTKFKLTLGNGSAELKINGKRKAVPDRSDAVGYLITTNGRQELSKAKRPTCQ